MPTPPSRIPNLYCVELHFGHPTSDRQDVFTNHYPTESAAKRAIMALPQGHGSALRAKVWHRGNCVLTYEFIGQRPVFTGEVRRLPPAGQGTFRAYETPEALGL
jgi:hypothetical protein